MALGLLVGFAESEARSGNGLKLFERIRRDCNDNSESFIR